MENDETNASNGATDNTPPDTNGAANGTPDNPPAAARPAQPAREKKVIPLTTDTIGRLKREAEDRGAKRTMTELENRVKGAGFASMDEMFLAIAQSRNAKKEPAADAARTDRTNDGANGKPANNGGGTTREQRNLQRQAAQNEALRRKLSKEITNRKRMQAVIDAQKAEMIVRTTAVRAGITDVDYALLELQRHTGSMIQGLDDAKAEAALRDFDDEKFFKDLLAKKPYLGGEVVKPATTGTGGGGAPPPDPPGQKKADDARAAQVDVRKMNPTEYREHLRKQGLTPPS